MKFSVMLEENGKRKKVTYSYILENDAWPQWIYGVYVKNQRTWRVHIRERVWVSDYFYLFSE